MVRASVHESGQMLFDIFLPIDQYDIKAYNGD